MKTFTFSYFLNENFENDYIKYFPNKIVLPLRVIKMSKKKDVDSKISFVLELCFVKVLELIRLFSHSQCLCLII